jgi:hypothetical protein
MIDLDTGRIVIQPDNVVISPKMSEEDFRMLPFRMERIIDRYQVNYRKHLDVLYRFTAQDLEGNEFCIWVSYKRPPDAKVSHLEYVSLSHCPKQKSKSNVLNDFEKMDVWHKNWMKKHFGKSTRIEKSWGFVEAIIELKSPSAEIFISFN